jgi:hypothetical protein
LLPHWQIAGGDNRGARRADRLKRRGGSQSGKNWRFGRSLGSGRRDTETRHAIGRSRGQQRCRLKPDGGLNPRFDAAGYYDAFEVAVAEPGLVGFERVLAHSEQGEAEAAVPRRGPAKLGAGRLVAQHQR